MDPDEKKVDAVPGFVAALPPSDAEAVVEETADGRIIGEVEAAEQGCVSIRGLELS